MRRYFFVAFIIFMFNGAISGQTQNGILRTGIISQTWSIERIKNPITEITFPIEVNYPIRENLNIQVDHIPAISSFGDTSLSGLSDTWIRSNYRFANDRALVSVGLGIPTGKTKLNFSEVDLSTKLSINAFKFQLPVFGQGLTLSSGIMYAQPINEKITVGGGINFVLRNEYKINVIENSQLVPSKYDPGEQIGISLGCDYLIIPDLHSSMDFIFSYYTPDKLTNSSKATKFVSGLKYCLKIGAQYQAAFGQLWMLAYYRGKAKNETWDYQALVLSSEDKNANITLRELALGAKIPLSKTFSILPTLEVRSYVENDFKKGGVDLFGAGFGYELQLIEKLSIQMGAKILVGYGEYINIIRDFSGFELLMGTQWKL